MNSWGLDAQSALLEGLRVYLARRQRSVRRLREHHLRPMGDAYDPVVGVVVKTE